MNINRTVNKYKLEEQPSDFAFWQTRPCQERIAALEEIRRDYHAWKYHVEPGFHRVYRIVKQS